MRPDDRELDDEIRGHLAIEIQQRIDRGESPQQARINALRQFGYLPQMKEEMHRVWYSRWYDMAEALVQEMRVGLRADCLADAVAMLRAPLQGPQYEHVEGALQQFQALRFRILWHV